jgi:hypothetical protein
MTGEVVDVRWRQSLGVQLADGAKQNKRREKSKKEAKSPAGESRAFLV